MDDVIYRQKAIDVYEKCMLCKHVYKRKDDDDTLYCRCRKECRYEEFKPKRSNRNADEEQSEPERTMEEFMFGQDMGNPEDGSL